jgi:hypothetical protein
MAHFAELDNNNKVIRVLVVADEFEADGENWCSNLFGGRWKQTSYNNRIRYNYAGVGSTYDEEHDAFYCVSPYASWVLDERFQWKPPIDYPDDGKVYFWNEDIIQWQELLDENEVE